MVGSRFGIDCDTQVVLSNEQLHCVITIGKLHYGSKKINKAVVEVRTCTVLMSNPQGCLVLAKKG